MAYYNDNKYIEYQGQSWRSSKLLPLLGGYQTFSRMMSMLPFQGLLTIQPDLGAIIPGGGGIRKLRWAAKQRGKSGGVRIIYYWVVSHELVYMLTAYSKNEQSDLSPSQLQFLRHLVEEEFS